MSLRPDEPWRPTNFRVFRISSTTRRTETRGSGTRAGPERTETVYDVRYRVDRFDFRYRFTQKGYAETFVRHLHADFVRGWLFDPKSRRFVDPHAEVEPAHVLTVYEHFRSYVDRKWRTWAPSSRKIAQTDLARACLFLLADEAPQLTADEADAAIDHLRNWAFMPGAEPTEATAEWDAWFWESSLPLAEVTDVHLQDFIDDVRAFALDGRPRTLAPSSLRRVRAVVQGAFTHALKRRLIDWNPWGPVHLETSEDRHRVDPDLVMDPAQVMELAEACAAIDPRYRAYVLVQGLCGVRPGEAGELRRRDVERAADGSSQLRVRGTRSDTPERFFLDHEDRSRPLKGHGPRFSRRVPIPAALVAPLEEHLRRCVDPGAEARIFTAPAGTPINPSNFQRGVWRPARAEVFPADHPLRGVRRHDLRHSAITAWLNAGVPLKTAQAWSGHRTLSVLLDTYAGVLQSDEPVAVDRVDRFYEAFATGFRDTLVTRSSGRDRLAAPGATAANDGDHANPEPRFRRSEAQSEEREG